MPASNRSSSRAARLARWDIQSTTRNAHADPEWKEIKEASLRNKNAESHSMPPGLRVCSGTASCSCRKCVFARWDTRSEVNRRAAIRLDPSSPPSSSPSSNDDCSWTDDSATDVTAPQCTSFGGFGLFKAVDCFAPLNGIGPSLTITALDLPGESGAEQSLLVGNLKLTVIERPSVRSQSALPETITAVYKRQNQDSTYEKVYWSRRLASMRTASIDDLATSLEHASRLSEQGDARSVAATIKSLARSYGITTEELVDSVIRVAPSQIGRALADLSV